MFSASSIGAMFQESVTRYEYDPCVSYKKSGQEYQIITFKKLDLLVRQLALYLMEQGVKKGDKVVLFSPNRYEWWVADLAILSIGAVNVPIFATSSADEAGYIIKNSDATYLMAGTANHLATALQGAPNIKEALVFDEIDHPQSGVITMSAALAQGARHTDPAEFDRRLASINETDMATFIYTSGTTGDPKGVMLTHGNLVSNAKQTYLAIKPTFDLRRQKLLSFLPLSHAFERTVGYYTAIYSGSHVYFAGNPVEDVRLVRPTMLVSVPRIYEMVHALVQKKMAQASGFKKILFNLALCVARKNVPYICNNKPRKGLYALCYCLADKLVFSKLKTAIGLDRLDLGISGGGPLSVADAEFFLGIGIRVVEGFGLSECSPVTNVNPAYRIKPGTVGPAYVDTKQKISADGELLIKGPQVMQGYYRNEKATREAFTEDGYVKTGDLAEIDSDGYVTITGRIKDIIITSGGKNISPQNIENRCKNSPYINQICILGDRRKYIIALIVPAFENLEAWAREQGLSFKSKQELIEHELVISLFHQELHNHNNKNTELHSQVLKFSLLNTEWTQETEELTPTQKVKRQVISKKFAHIIKKLYEEE